MPARVRGIDHIGITVPDIEAATRFLTEAFGCEELYRTSFRGDGTEGGGDPAAPDDDPLRALLGTAPGSQILELRLLKFGTGTTIELFQFGPTDSRLEDCPLPNDLAIQHFGVYVDDLDAAIEQVREAGGTLLEGPSPLQGPEAGDGNRFIYGRTPWGAFFELLTYPAGCAYEGDLRGRRYTPPLP